MYEFEVGRKPVLMYSLSLDHSGRSSHESKERWTLGFLLVGLGGGGRFDCLWRMLEDVMGAVANEHSLAGIIVKICGLFCRNFVSGKQAFIE